MNNRVRVSAALLSVVTIAACFGIYSKDRVEAATRPQEPQKSSVPSQQPAANGTQPESADPESVYGPSFAFLAWNLFLRAMAPVNGSLTIETWTEQCQLNPNMVGCPSPAILA